MEGRGEKEVNGGSGVGEGVEQGGGDVGRGRSSGILQAEKLQFQ
jgi:hypothetical protein